MLLIQMGPTAVFSKNKHLLNIYYGDPHVLLPHDLRQTSINLISLLIYFKMLSNKYLQNGRKRHLVEPFANLTWVVRKYSVVVVSDFQL